MAEESVKEGDWITVGDSRINAYVTSVHSSSEVSAGYHQNQLKAIKEDFVLKNGRWEFKHSGPSGSYLSGHLESIIKRGS